MSNILETNATLLLENPELAEAFQKIKKKMLDANLI